MIRNAFGWMILIKFVEEKAWRGYGITEVYFALPA
jgi:hypothetical protein